MRQPVRTPSSGPAPTRTVVHLLRHGKVHNPGAILYGRLPGYRLARSGEAMAELVAAHLGDRDITYLAASSLLRAQQTAGPLAARRNLDIHTDDRVIEAGNRFEGMTVAVGDGVFRDPRHWIKLVNPFRPSWGEPYLEIAHRMLGAIYTAVQAAAGHEAVLVSHQLPIWTARRYLEGRRLWHNPSRRECAVASVTSLTFDDGVFSALRYEEPAAAIEAVDDPASTESAQRESAQRESTQPEAGA